MAFYPDELSPIEKLRSAGKSSELSDLNLMSMNRRQWKSLVLGKKDLGMNNFATIAEEKEEDISSDGSNGANVNQKTSNSFVSIPNKKITFPKPRKYITSRVAERKEEVKPQEVKAPEEKKQPVDDLSKITNSPKMNLPEVRQLIKNRKEEFPVAKQEFVANYAFNDLNSEKQLRDAMAPPMLTGWPKMEEEKPKVKEEKKKLIPGKTKKAETKKPQLEATQKSSKTQLNQESKGAKTLNMKDVVNVYKNLTYGTKDEIKSFVEKLSLVKDEEKAENDKNLLSMMNLKALETKIKDLEKKTTGQGPASAKKRNKTGKKARKVHTENLARHKVVKVPATLGYAYPPDSRNLSYGSGGSSEQKRKSNEDKVPWKYVGTQSVLDKTYFVYPSYPQPERKKMVKKADCESKKAKKDGGEDTSGKGKVSQSKVKQFSIRQNLGLTGSQYGTSGVNRSPATTVCTVEFRPEMDRKEPFGAGPSDQSLLVYLHGTKATYVKSPYSDKQFSRVKFFRKDGTRVPLIRGVAVGTSNRDVTVRNVRLPDRLTSDRVVDLLDFEEDIQNINEFLHSQNRSGGPAPKSHPDWQPRTLLKPASGRKRTVTENALTESIVEEISQDIENLQFLPDTQENRQIIGEFFDELDQRIERSKARHLLRVDKYNQNNSNNNSKTNNTNSNNNNTNNNNKNNNNCLIPIVGY